MLQLSKHILALVVGDGTTVRRTGLRQREASANNHCAHRIGDFAGNAVILGE